jgi:tRNA (cmo5U34)-methyltransferase
MKNVEYELAELGAYEFKGKYDAIISSLALHHLKPGKAKAAVYGKICRALDQGGIFVNADIIVSSHPKIQKRYLEKWAEFILRSYSRAQVAQNYRRYKREDRPAVLLEEIAQLKRAGFAHAEIFWKYYNFATYGAIK